MVDPYDPATWESGVKAITGAAKLLDSLRKKLSRGGGSATRERLDALVGVVKDILDMMGKSNHDTARNLNGVLDAMSGHNQRVLDVIKGLNHRIGVLERAAKKKPRKPVKRKRRRT
jgi:ABC-type transporter Mla subunit MlaD